MGKGLIPDIFTLRLDDLSGGTEGVNGYFDVARRSGIGLGVLLILSVFISAYYESTIRSLLGQSEMNQIIVVTVAAIPSLLVWTMARQFNDEVVKFIAGEKVTEAYVRIKYHQGDKRFYVDYDGDLQKALDELDKKFHQEAVNILSGVAIIALGLGVTIIEFSRFGLWSLSVVLGTLLFAGVVLVLPSYRRLNEILEHAVRVAEGT